MGEWEDFILDQKNIQILTDIVFGTLIYQCPWEYEARSEGQFDDKSLFAVLGGVKAMAWMPFTNETHTRDKGLLFVALYPAVRLLIVP